jgi:type IV pilus assembly protein PilC
MSTLIHSIGEKFSDFWLDLELFFGRFSHRSASLEPIQESKNLGSLVRPEKTTSAEGLPLSLKIVHLGNHDRWFFFDQMATLASSGVTLIDSLSLLQAQSQSKAHKRLYAEMIHRINGGATLADTMSLFTRAFSPMQFSLVEAGEKSGNLKAVFARIAEDIESQQEFARKITGAMFYPLVVLFLALTMVTGMIIFVIPKVSQLYEQSHAKLPALTQTVIDLSHFVALNYPILFGSLALFILLVWVLVTKTRPGRWASESLISALPVFGEISRQKNIMALASNLGMLLESSVLISNAFEITEKTLDNLHYKKALADIHHGIILGKNVSEMMGLKDLKAQKFEVNRLFPLQVAQMIHIGEITGNLSKMLIKIRDNYHKSIDYTLKNLSTLVEPLMIFLVALLVGSILLAVMLPFFYIGTTIH